MTAFADEMNRRIRARAERREAPHARAEREAYEAGRAVSVTRRGAGLGVPTETPRRYASSQLAPHWWDGFDGAWEVRENPGNAERGDDPGGWRELDAMGDPMGTLSRAERHQRTQEHREAHVGRRGFTPLLPSRGDDGRSRGNPAAPAEPDVGRQFGPWRSLRKLGGGGYGDVYLAVDAAGREAAVKVYVRSREAVRDRGAEAAILEALVDCPNVPSLLGQGFETVTAGPQWGTLSGTHQGHAWLAMQYIPGPTVSAEVPLSPDSALRMVRDVGYALECAHHSGIVHGDIKPDNVVHDSAHDRYVLIDFGLASPMSAAEALKRGTPGFVAVEKIDERFRGEYDARSDVYALAALYVAAMTGRSPFDSKRGPAATLRNQLDDGRPPVADLREIVGAGAPTVWAALAAEPNERPANVADFLAGLGRAAPVAAEYNLVPSFRIAAQAVALFPAADVQRWREHFSTQPLAFEAAAQASPETRLPELFRDPLAPILATWLIAVQSTPAKAARALADYARRAGDAIEGRQAELALSSQAPPTPLELRRQTLGTVAAVGSADPAEVERVGAARWLSGRR